MKKPILVVAILLFSFISTAWTVFAAPITLAGFSGSESVEDFEGIPTGIIGTSFTEAGVTFTDVLGGTLSGSPAAGSLFSNVPSNGSGAALLDDNNNARLNIDFSTTVNRVGVAISSGSILQWTVSIFDTSLSFLESVTVVQPGEILAVFVGFERIENIGRIQIERTSQTAKHWFTFIDDVHYEQLDTDPIPEPTTIALLGIGLVGLAGAEVRRRKKKAVNNS